MSLEQVRPAAVAGTFYPGSAAELTAEVDALLAAVPDAPRQSPPKALIAPHAGYVYSGPIAASAFALLRRLAGRVRRVVLLGPAHRVAIHGLALPGAGALATPLGTVPVDAELAAAVAGLPQVGTDASAHAEEHSLEVELPFLQRLLGDFSLLPLVVGAATPREVAEVLEAVWGGEETLVVVSSDLSHYLPYDVARATDRATVDAILALRGPLDPRSACGALPINGLLLAARAHRLTPELVDLRSSGDTAGNRRQVVGYAAIAFTEGAADA